MRPAVSRKGRLPAVLIVDDSVVARAALARAIELGGRFRIAGAVPDAYAALEFLGRERVDAILLDIEMPGVDGLTALPDLLTASKGARVLIVSSACREGATSSVQALTLGAADTLVKPEAGTLAGRFGALLHEKLERLFEPEEATAPRHPAARELPGVDFDIVAIGASTGGIHALSQLLREIPVDFALPILITQHLPDSFMPYFAAQVAVLAGRPCSVAQDGERIRPGRLLIAPGEGHLRCVRLAKGAAIRLSREPVASGCLPSVDPMFASIAEIYGARGLGVVLSGMGRDGGVGARALCDAGGTVIVQDRASSVVWGMPGAAASAGAQAILSPTALGQFIARRRRPA